MKNKLMKTKVMKTKERDECVAGRRKKKGYELNRS
jgi:hypothetical protein